MSSQNVFERVEKKYRLNQKQYELFLDAVSGKIHMDEYGLHTIRNIYYDTSDYELIGRSTNPDIRRSSGLEVMVRSGKTVRYFLRSRRSIRGLSISEERRCP